MIVEFLIWWKAGSTILIQVWRKDTSQLIKQGNNTIQEKILATKELVHGESKKIHVKDCSQMTSSIF